jgi:hypothetical protein
MRHFLFSIMTLRITRHHATGIAGQGVNMRQTRVPAEFLVAPAQHGSVANDPILPSACQWFGRFGTIGRSFSRDVRRFRWQAQKA